MTVDQTIHELTCAELVELVTDFLDGALAPAERTRFEQHVHACDGCRAYLDQITTLGRVAGRLPADALSGESRRALLAAFRGWRTTAPG